MDFKKAYDHMDWQFLDFVLNKKGYGGRWRSWIRRCLSTYNMFVLVNGKPGEYFKASRGFRHGAPLCPFLFILAAYTGQDG